MAKVSGSTEASLGIMRNNARNMLLGIHVPNCWVSFDFRNIQMANPTLFSAGSCIGQVAQALQVLGSSDSPNCIEEYLALALIPTNCSLLRAKT